MKNKFPQETKEAVLTAYSYMCANKGCFEQVTEFHHILPNTKGNQKRFPLFLQSPFNCFPICHGCHMNKPLPPKPTERLVQTFEDYLISISVLPEALH